MKQEGKQSFFPVYINQPDAFDDDPLHITVCQICLKRSHTRYSFLQINVGRLEISFSTTTKCTTNIYISNDLTIQFSAKLAAFVKKP